MNVGKLKTRIKSKEGLRLKPYVDSVGVLTIGWGRNLMNGITREEAELMLLNDLSAAIRDCEEGLPFFEYLNDVRQNVLVEMRYNLGMGGLLGFKKTLLAIASGDYESAAREMLNSNWARQVGRRADELAEMMRKGEFGDGG